MNVTNIAKVVLNNGVEFPLLGLGTYRLYDPQVKPVVQEALKTGYRLIDTAAVYHNESDIGDVLSKFPDLARKDIFITSKLGPSDQGTERCQLAALDSLKQLQLSYLDLYLIHWPGVGKLRPENSRHTVLRKESWLELEQLYKKGVFRAIGVSNYTVHHLKELLSYCSVVPAVLQVEVHPYLVQKDLRQFCKDHNIHVQAYSSLGSESSNSELLMDATVQEIACVHSRSSAQVLLRWAIQHGMSVIPKTSKTARLKENIQVFDFELSEEEMNRLDGLDRGMHYCWDPTSIL